MHAPAMPPEPGPEGELIVERLFGIPVEAFATGLAVIMALAFGLIAVAAARNRVFLRMAARNVTRRRGRSALIVAGLMLATAIITSSLVTGDTMSSTIRSSALRSLGSTDETVVAAGAELDPTLEVDAAPPVATFDGSAADVVRDAAAGSPLVDGVTTALIRPARGPGSDIPPERARCDAVRHRPRQPGGLRAADRVRRSPPHTGRAGPRRGVPQPGRGGGRAGRPSWRPPGRAPGAAPVELVVHDVVGFRGVGTDGRAGLGIAGPGSTGSLARRGGSRTSSCRTTAAKWPAQR